MKSVQPTKDALFAIRGRSTASSMKQTVFSRLYRFHILTFMLVSIVNGTAVNCYQTISVIVKSVFVVLGLLLATTVYSSTEQLKLVSQIIQIKNHFYTVRIPEGYVLHYILSNMDRPRIISFGIKEEMFIGSRSGNVYRLTPPYNKADILISLQHYPHSVVVRGSYIYIVQTNGLYRAPYQAGQAKIYPHSLKRYAKLPAGPGHNSRTLRLGADNRLYVSLGISGNCSNQYLDDSYPPSARRGGVLVLTEKKNNVKWETYASGLRNPVGFDWQPGTG